MAGSQPQQTRVAIIGTGLAGLTTAYLLKNDQQGRYGVTLFEQAERLSFDSASVAVRKGKTGVVERIDVPMRASAGGYYANLMSMYKHLGIPLHPVRFLFVFAKALSAAGKSAQRQVNDHSYVSRTGGGGHDDTAQHKVESEAGAYFVHASNLHQTPPPWPANRGVLAHLAEIIYLIVCHFWFSVACFVVEPRRTNPGARSTIREGESLADYLERIWLPRRYVSQYLLPLMSSVSTCSHEEMLQFPASDIVSYKRLSHGRQHYVVCGGVEQVQSRLVERMEDVRLGSRVMEIVPTSGGTLVRWQSWDLEDSSQSREEVFDRVVLAVSPDVAGRIYRPLATAMATIPTIRVESSVMSPTAFKTGTDSFSVVETHDASSTACMHHGGDVTAAQIITFKTRFSSDDTSRTEALHTMPSGVIVQTCPLDDGVDPKKALQTAAFTRTLRTTQSRALVERLVGKPGRSPSVAKKTDEAATDWANGKDNVWLTGAWCWDGMVLLEGCVVSAMRVADDFGVTIPWARH